MSVEQLRPFPTHLRLKELAALTGRVFELKLNPHKKEAAKAASAWFDSHNVYHGLNKKRFTSHAFDSYPGMSFVLHLKTCIVFFLWAFSRYMAMFHGSRQFDDPFDEGALQSKPEAHHVGVDISMEVLRNPTARPPDFPSAAMLHDIWRRLMATATQEACSRFFHAVESWMDSQVEQTRNQATDKLSSLGGGFPKKEQADGDFQNLVFCIMIERDCDLQTAIDILTDMLSQRVVDYEGCKAQLPSFEPEVDAELARYVKADEQYTQGTVVWYHRSPRYFRGQDVSGIPEIVVPVYERSITPVA
ncbi:terpenoid synthase [Ganoderma leucocontextum]|nr:terpenoid synthase [Ganoderma leucocontextum]